MVIVTITSLASLHPYEIYIGTISPDCVNGSISLLIGDSPYNGKNKKMEKTKKVKKKRKWLVFQKIEFRIGKCETNLFPTLTIKKPTNQKLK